MASLYTLTNDYQEVQGLASDPDIDEQTILDTLESIEGAIEGKADSYAFIIDGINADVEAIKKEEQRLATRRKSLENHVEVMKQSLETAMRATGKIKFATTLHNFGIQKSGGVQGLDIFGDVTDEYKKEVLEVDNAKIREDLVAGKTLPFAKLKERSEKLRIR